MAAENEIRYGYSSSLSYPNFQSVQHVLPQPQPPPPSSQHYQSLPTPSPPNPYSSHYFQPPPYNQQPYETPPPLPPYYQQLAKNPPPPLYCNNFLQPTQTQTPYIEPLLHKPSSQHFLTPPAYNSHYEVPSQQFTCLSPPYKDHPAPPYQHQQSPQMPQPSSNPCTSHFFQPTQTLMSYTTPVYHEQPPNPHSSPSFYHQEESFWPLYYQKPPQNPHHVPNPNTCPPYPQQTNNYPNHESQNAFASPYHQQPVHIMEHQQPQTYIFGEISKQTKATLFPDTNYLIKVQGEGDIVEEVLNERMVQGFIGDDKLQFVEEEMVEFSLLGTPQRSIYEEGIHDYGHVLEFQKSELQVLDEFISNNESMGVDLRRANLTASIEESVGRVLKSGLWLNARLNKEVEQTQFLHANWGKEVIEETIGKLTKELVEGQLVRNYEHQHCILQMLDETTPRDEYQQFAVGKIRRYLIWDPGEVVKFTKEVVGEIKYGYEFRIELDLGDEESCKCVKLEHYCANFLQPDLPDASPISLVNEMRFWRLCNKVEWRNCRKKP